MDGDGKLTVRSSDLFHAAHQVTQASEAIGRAASSAYGECRADAGRWVGASKKALERAVEQLEKHSTDMTKELTNRAERISYSGREYADTERRNAERQRKSGQSSNPTLNMDH
ncbi:Excreted virulence factor EspC, type VII ESX diderm [Williamsia serinedens]|uniref:Excreted virulence factor EspC, type VII ESX diderm n=1 Tax=Williamsia serinedens TaxID=391736 RepID=A0ABT1H4K7_9NOCA|nr:Excreted virulence factor EspC, type VII ESX diderm [Williamsia serinedens]